HLDNAKPRDTSYRMWDSGGLYVEVQPSGGKWWRWKYRFAGKEKRLALGTYPDSSIKQARGKRDDARKLLDKGIDPSAARKAEKRTAAVKAGNTFEAVAREWYGKQSKIWVAHHASDVL